ncbi:unnamed protein product [Sphagnum troendelagicum]|uniref:Uncharacterized protein n=1 Tax=Sphagnum troendelagicum TaxID=128251 RepID=A0ABP0UMG3_9BRYO
MLAAHAFRSPKVVIADISVEQLNVTTELGADATVLVSTDLKINVKPLITTRFGFFESKVKHAFERSARVVVPSRSSSASQHVCTLLIHVK